MKSESSPMSDLMQSILVMKPKPSLYRLIRIGGDRDGAYLIPDDLEGVEACFSPGVNNFKRFEDELTDAYGIKCHMCDYSSDVDKFQTPLREGMQTFKKKWLDIDGSENSISLESWISELAPADNRDLLLQMDIEGAEYRNILNCRDEVLKRFRIIVLEVHGLHVANNPLEFEKSLGPLLRKLDQSFVCVHAHPNNCCGDSVLAGTALNVPHVHELTLLRRDRLAQRQGSQLYEPLIPHPLDINGNCLSNPPLFLSKAWCHKKTRLPTSRMKMLRIQLNYTKSRLFRKIKNVIKTGINLSREKFCV